MSSDLTDRERDELERLKSRLEQADRLVPLLNRFYSALVLEHAQGRPLEEQTYLLLLSDAQDALAAWNSSGGASA